VKIFATKSFSVYEKCYFGYILFVPLYFWVTVLPQIHSICDLIVTEIVTHGHVCHK